MISTTEFIKQAESLPFVELAGLIDSLTALMHKTDPDVEQAWLDVAEERLRAIEDGKIELIPGEEVLKKANESLGQ